MGAISSYQTSVPSRHSAKYRCAEPSPKRRPFFHDQPQKRTRSSPWSAATLEELLAARNPDDLHGATSHLSGDELDDLIAFLLSIE